MEYLERNPEAGRRFIMAADPTVRRDHVADEVRAAADRKRLGLPPIPMGDYVPTNMPPYVPKPK